METTDVRNDQPTGKFGRFRNALEVPSCQFVGAEGVRVLEPQEGIPGPVQVLRGREALGLQVEFVQELWVGWMDGWRDWQMNK